MSSATARRARQSPAPGSPAAAAILGAVLFAMGLVEWGSAWFFPVDGRNYLTITRPFGSEYRILLWAVVSLAAVALVMSGRLRVAFRGFAPYAAFLAVAVTAAVFGDQNGNSAWYVAQWVVMVTAGLAAGALAPAAELRRAGLLVFAGVLLGSLLLYLLLPSIGSMQSGGRGGLLRGLFPGKQFAGWFAALACIWAILYRDGRLGVVRIALLALALVVLARAQSAGAVAVLAAGLGYWVFVRMLAGLRLPVAAKATVSLAALAAAGLAVQVALPLILQVLGRDPTLTGRTELWGVYWRFMGGSPLIGRGPGAFAPGSPLNFSISPYLDKDQVVTLHNTYLALFGDTGLLGVAAYAAGLLFIAVVAPFRRPGAETTTAAVLAVMILGAGFSEARDTLAPSVATFMILALRSRSLVEAPARTAAAAFARSRATRAPATLQGRLRPAAARSRWS